MTRKDHILILLFLSWPVNNLFRFLSLPEDGDFRPFLLSGEVVAPDWYVWHIGGSLSYILIFWAMWLYINGNYKRDRSILTIFGAVFINQISDIVHYLLWQRHFEGFIVCQALVIMIAGIINLRRYLKRNDGAKR